MLTGEAGFLRILPGQIRAPDVSFIRWERLPDRHVSKPAIYAAVPDLAVEIISEANTEAEMDRKLHEYFQAGVRFGVAHRAQKPLGAGLHCRQRVAGNWSAGFPFRRRGLARFRIAVGATFRPRRRAAGVERPSTTGLISPSCPIKRVLG